MRRYQVLGYGMTTVTDIQFLTDFWFDSAGRRDFVLMNRQTTPRDPANDYELRVYYNDAGRVLRIFSTPQQSPADVRALLVEIDKTWRDRTVSLGCE